MSNQNQPDQPNRPAGPASSPLRGLAMWMFLLLGMFVLLVFAQKGVGPLASPPAEVGYTELREIAASGQLDKATVTERAIVATLKAGQKYKDHTRVVATLPPGDVTKDVVAFLDQNQVKITGAQPSQLLPILYILLLVGVPTVVLMTMMRRANPAQHTLAFGKSRARQYMETDVKTTFADVAGIDEPRAELEEIVDYLREPDRFRRLGGRIPRGVLLVGAPGTGKTLLAKALAGEAKVPFFSMSGSDFVELFVGIGASRVRDLFRQAEAVAGHRGCIVFIDELDALGKARGASIMGGAHDEREQTLNQLLVEMDGFDTRASIIVMAATNRPEILDPALMRPGRFDRQVMIPAPDVTGREAILKVHARKVKVSPELDLRRVAVRTPGFVGADLANVVNEAALLAARNAKEQVDFAEFDEAIDRVSLGLSRRSQVLSSEEKRAVAVHESGHAVAAAFCEHADPIHKVTIIPRGVTGGVTQFSSDRDKRLHTEPELHDLLVTLLGGRVAEELVLGVITTGAFGDIQQITRTARAMVLELGMSAELGPINYDNSARTDPFGFPLSGGQKHSEATSQRIDAEVRRIVDEAYARTRAILTEHRSELDRLADRLGEVETLDRPEVYQLLGLPEPQEHHDEANGQATLTEPTPAETDTSGT